jgi:hypothetical protein
MSKANEKKAREALQAAGVKSGVINSIIEQAAKTGKSGISANELAFIQKNASQLEGQTKSQVDAKAFLGTTGSRMEALSGGGQPAPRTEVRRTNNSDGSVTIFYSDGFQETIGGNVGDPRVDAMLAQEQRERVSAYAILENTFRVYGLDELVPTIQQFLKQNLSSAEATLQLRESPVFKERFKGNTGRKALGLPEYEPGEYVQAEETYSNILRANNLSALANKDTFAKLIGGAVSPVEVQDRVNLVFNKIDTAPDDVKKELTRYFSQYNISDPNYQRLQLAQALLSGEDTAKTLEMNVRKAQLRAGATSAGFDLREERITALERLLSESGVSNTYAAGQAGFQALSRIQPQAEVFAERYQMAPVEETELEKEAFLGLESQKRKKLLEQEKATFAGSAGITQASLATSPAGQI